MYKPQFQYLKQQAQSEQLRVHGGCGRVTTTTYAAYTMVCMDMRHS